MTGSPYCRAKEKFIFHSFRPIGKDLARDDAHQNLLINCQFRENDTLIRKVKQSVQYLCYPAALPGFGAIRYKRPAHMAVERLFTDVLETGVAKAVRLLWR